MTSRRDFVSPTDLQTLSLFYKGILLDLDNTLYAYEPCHTYALKKCHAYYSIHIKKIGYNAFYALYLKARTSVKRLNKKTAASRSRYLYFQSMLENSGPDHLMHALALGALYEQAYLTKVKLSDSAHNFLKKIKKAGLPVVLVSNQEISFQLKKIKKLRIKGLYKYLVTSAEAGVEKPDVRIFRLALAKIGLKPDDVVMLGDDPKEDGAGAKRAGIPFILYANRVSQ